MIQINDISWLLPLRQNLELLNNAIYNTTDRIQNLDNSLANLNNRINTFTNNKLQLTPKFRKSINVTPSDENITDVENVNSAKKHGNSKKKYIEAATSLGELAESNLTLASAFRKLSPVIERVKGGVEFLNGGLKAVSGIEAFSAAGEMIERLIGAGAIIAGIEGIIAAAAFINPIVLGTGAVVLGGVAAIELGKHFSKQPDTLKNNFSGEALQKGNPYLQDVSNNDNRVTQYVKLATTPKKKSASQITNEVEILKRNFLQQGGIISFDKQKAADKDPTYLRALVAALNYNDTSKRKQITDVEFETTADLLAFRGQFDKFEHFPLYLIPYLNDTLRLSNTNVTPGSSIWSGSNQIIPKKKRRIDPEPASKSILKPIHDIALKTVIQSYLTNGFPYVQKEYQNYIKQFPSARNQANQVWKEFQGIKKFIDNEHTDVLVWQNLLHKKQNGDDDKYTPKNPETGRAGVIINLNKPMIGNFTINTRDIKEGLTDFKHKVEEVLLEILNSANVI